jgi:tetratricopeptide (TPR) repeat protein
MDPHFISAHRLLSMSYQGKGMFDKAISENEKWGQHSGNEVKTKVALAQIYAAAGQKEAARKLISEIETAYTLTGNDYRGMALIYAALGENDLAFEWLEKSCERREESLCSIKVDPKLDPIRSDPRFDAIILKMGMNI